MVGILCGGQVFNLRYALEQLSLVEDGRHVTPQEAVIVLALRIEEIFSGLCLARFGRRMPVGKNGAAHLYHAAQLCLRLQETPEVFVNKQVRAMTQFSKFWVSALASERLHQIAEAEANVTLEAIRYYKSQLALFSSRCRLCGPAVAIEDTANEFSPLFRFVIATELELPHVAAIYKSEAEQELNLNPVARDVFGSKLERCGLVAHGAALPSVASADPAISGDS